MNFNKIEIRGFKSFADKVTIDFKDGVTAIIGPNGCGKSNIADAIRWTLGEQSAKSLRGKNMQDVIFNGTETRHSTSYCEVSLYFDNTDHQVFSNIDFDEVVITRKLDRSGNSEYQINKTRCRMKDIINLIHDTGIGKEGYSIIGQGRIDEILSAKPDDRRHIFEEAAGISKFRYQRTEAEHKLEKTMNNLAIASERISEIERQLVPLRKQAEATKKYNDFRDQLKTQEVNLYIYQYENNESVKTKIKDRLANAAKEASRIETEFSECVSEYDKCMRDMSSLDDVSKEYNAELLSLRVDAEKVAGEGKVFQERLANLTSDERRLSDELKSIDMQLYVLSNQIAKAKEQKEEKSKKFVELSDEQKKTEALVGELSLSLSDAENQLESKSKDYYTSIEELASLKSNLSSFTTECGIQQDRAKNIQALLNQKKRHLDEETTALTIAESNFSSAKEKMRSLVSEHNEIISNREEAKEAVLGYNEDILSFNTKLGVMEGNLRSLISIKEDYAGYQGAVQALMNDAKANQFVASKMLGVVAEIIDVPTDYIAAVENALGSSLQNIVCETEEDASYLIDYLKQKRYGRATFRPISACRPKSLNPQNRAALNERGCLGLVCDLISYDHKFDKIMSALLGDTVIVDNKTTGIRLFRTYNQSFRIVTLDGDIFSQNGSMTGGSRRNEKSGLLEQEKNIAIAKENLEKLKLNLSKIMNMRAEKQKEIQESEHHLTELESNLSEVKVNCTLYEERTKLATQSVEKLKVEIAADAVDLETIQSSVKELNQKIDSIDKLEKYVAQKKEELGSISQISKTSSTDKKIEKEKELNHLMELRLEIATLKGTIDGLDAEIFRAQREETMLKETSLDTKSDHSSVTERIETLKNAPQRTDFTQKEKDRIKYLEQEIDALSDKKTYYNSRVLELDSLRSKLNEEKTAVAEKRVRDEGMLERVDIEIRSMQEHILEDYDLTYTSALSLKLEEFNSRESQTQITSLKREITKLGDVNLLAISDLQEMEERFSTLSEERDDIQSGYDDLKKIIAELTDEMVIKFTDAFNKINENFQQIFKKLFDGGNGKLILEALEPDLEGKTIDPLEAGIEIFAQPPGKKLQHISLLSGGEKALTAISILFAILQLKPMPFCVLDEIEAALDDANANLFSELLRMFSDKTQFIVITHRKPTMRNADSIYGVTMQEKGITKIVHVEFEEAMKHIDELSA
ncbi:MAG TPA: chromosome segregation protein SMC [Clostridia bacterium]|nr:chromosome segregation protein SMC [Clostridia bacterium]